MSDNTENKEIEFKEPEAVVEAAETAPENAESGEISAEEGILKLKKQLEDSNNALLKAEQERRTLQQRISGAEVEVQDTNLQLLRSAIDSVGKENGNLQREYAMALRDGNFDRASEINVVIAHNASKLTALENGRMALEERLKAPPRPSAPDTNDPVELRAAALSPKSAAWVRRNPDLARDDRMWAKVMGAHYEAVSEGHAPESDDYFNYIENKVQKPARPQRQMDQDEEEPFSSASKPSAKRPPAAPTSSTASSFKSSRNAVRLTDNEREMAKISGYSEEEWAKFKLMTKSRMN
jgi:hypothetical protein